jgi:hypothetical protein
MSSLCPARQARKTHSKQSACWEHRTPAGRVISTDVGYHPFHRRRAGSARVAAKARLSGACGGVCFFPAIFYTFPIFIRYHSYRCSLESSTQPSRARGQGLAPKCLQQVLVAACIGCRSVPNALQYHPCTTPAAAVVLLSQAAAAAVVVVVVLLSSYREVVVCQLAAPGLLARSNNVPTVTASAPCGLTCNSSPAKSERTLLSVTKPGVVCTPRGC